MRPRVVVMLVLFVCVLAGVSMWLLRTPTTTPREAPTTPFASIDVMGVQELRVEGTPPAGVLQVRVDASTHSWLASVGAGPSVPVSESRVRGLLRLLDLAQRQPAQPREPGMEFGGPAIELVASDGTSHRLRFSATSFAGERMMLEEADAAAPNAGWVRRVESHVAEACEAFVNARQAPIVPWSGTVVAIDRLRLPLAGSPDAFAQLSRRGNDWALVAPVQARVDASSLARVLTLLTSSVPYEVTANSSAGENARVVLEVGGVMPNDNADRPSRITITVHTSPRPTDTSGVVRAVCVASHDAGLVAWGPYTALLQPAFLAEVPQNLDALLSRRASAVESADVASVAIARDVDAWTHATKLPPWDAVPAHALHVMMRESAAQGNTSSTVARAVRDLLLREVGRPTVDIASLPLATDEPGWRIELRGAAGSPLDVLALRATSDGTLAARSGDVAWVYTPDESRDFIRVLRDLPQP